MTPVIPAVRSLGKPPGESVTGSTLRGHNPQRRRRRRARLDGGRVAAAGSEFQWTPRPEWRPHAKSAMSHYRVGIPVVISLHYFLSISFDNFTRNFSLPKKYRAHSPVVAWSSLGGRFASDASISSSVCPPCRPRESARTTVDAGPSCTCGHRKRTNLVF